MQLILLTNPTKSHHIYKNIEQLLARGHSFCQEEQNCPWGKWKLLGSGVLVLSKHTLCSCLMVTLPACLFDNFMRCPFVVRKFTLYCCLMVAIPAWISYFFMNYPLLSNKFIPWSFQMATFPAWVFELFMLKCPFLGQIKE